MHHRRPVIPRPTEQPGCGRRRSSTKSCGAIGDGVAGSLPLRLNAVDGKLRSPISVDAAGADERRVVGHHVADAGLFVRIAVKHAVAAAHRQVAGMRHAVRKAEARSEVVLVHRHQAARPAVEPGVDQVCRSRDRERSVTKFPSLLSTSVIGQYSS